MMALVFIVTVAAIALPFYGLYVLHAWATQPHRVLGRQVAKLAKEASQAAKNGDYATRDRLDHARSSILMSMDRDATVKPFEGTEYDDFSARYLKP